MRGVCKVLGPLRHVLCLQLRAGSGLWLDHTWPLGRGSWPEGSSPRVRSLCFLVSLALPLITCESGSKGIGRVSGHRVWPRPLGGAGSRASSLGPLEESQVRTFLRPSMWTRSVGPRAMAEAWQGPCPRARPSRPSGVPSCRPETQPRLLGTGRFGCEPGGKDSGA